MTWADNNYDFRQAALDGNTVEHGGENTTGRLYIGWEGWRDLTGRSPLSGDSRSGHASYLTEASGRFANANVVSEPSTLIMFAVFTGMFFLGRRGKKTSVETGSAA